MKIRGSILCFPHELDAAYEYLDNKLKTWYCYDSEYNQRNIKKTTNGYIINFPNGDSWDCLAYDLNYTNRLLGQRRSVVFYSTLFKPEIIEECIKPLASIGLEICKPINFRYEKYLKLQYMVEDNDIENFLFEEK